MLFIMRSTIPLLKINTGQNRHDQRDKLRFYGVSDAASINDFNKYRTFPNPSYNWRNAESI